MLVWVESTQFNGFGTFHVINIHIHQMIDTVIIIIIIIDFIYRGLKLLITRWYTRDGIHEIIVTPTQIWYCNLKSLYKFYK